MLSKLRKQGRVAELGVCRGEFSDEIVKTATPDVLHLIDAWHTNRYDDAQFTEVSGKFSEQIQSGHVRLHRKLSLDAVLDFSDHYFDWIYIDTDHGYEATLQELIAYASKVKRDGVIAGHDYTLGNWVKSYRYGVVEAVHEFCVNFGWELAFLTVDPIEHQSFAIRRIAE